MSCFHPPSFALGGGVLFSVFIFFCSFSDLFCGIIVCFLVYKLTRKFLEILRSVNFIFILFVRKGGSDEMEGGEIKIERRLTLCKHKQSSGEGN